MNCWQSNNSSLVKKQVFMFLEGYVFKSHDLFIYSLNVNIVLNALFC